VNTRAQASAATKAPILQRINVVRPQMRPHPTCAALWLNSRGGALAYAEIADIFGRHSTSRLGFRITPHDARDAAVTLWALFAPDRRCARPTCTQRSAHYHQILQSGERDRNQPSISSGDHRNAQKARTVRTQLTLNQRVQGSSPCASTSKINELDDTRNRPADWCPRGVHKMPLERTAGPNGRSIANRAGLRGR
jgi:hypothetical protein